MIGTSFDSTKTPLQELLARARTGQLQLPDFQRGWVWDDEHIKSLLASVSVSFPIGAVMLLQTGGGTSASNRDRLQGLMTPYAQSRRRSSSTASNG